MRILIVEDEAASRRGLTDLLQSISPQHKIVGIAGNGEVWSAGLTPAGTPSPIKVIELSHGSRAHRA